MILLEIPSSPEYVAIVRQAVEGIAKRMAFNSGQIEDLKLAVGEACTNAVKHGCPKSSSDNVEIRCIVVSDGLLVEIRNSIFECEYPKVPDYPDTSKEGGFGLYLIHRLMDEVDMSWEQERATIKMLKRLNHRAA